MQYRYLGENTVQINKCVRRAVHAAITAAALNVVNTVRKARCCRNTLLWPAFRFLTRRVLVAKVQYIGAAQLLIKVRIPTATALKLLTPL
jgi:hypothetical protein